MKKVNTLNINFKNCIEWHNIPKFRGGVISCLDNANILYHNHLGDSFRYAYPLIQYKRINDKASIICVGEGTEVIGSFFESNRTNIYIGNETLNLEIDSVYANQTLVQIWDDSFTYRIHRWLPLNEQNYPLYEQQEGLVERYSMLEKILTANILSFAKGIELTIDKNIVCKILNIEEPYYVRYKNIKLLAFNVIFKTNISLPNYIGLGKGVSLGHGTIRKTTK